MKKLLIYVEGLPDILKVIGCLLFGLLLGYVDFITRDFSLRMFYLFPIAFASWFIDLRAGIFISMACSVEIIMIQLFVTPAYVSVINSKSWHALVEVCYLLLSGFLLSKLKVSMELASKRSTDLEIANRELEAFNYTVAHDLRSPLVWIGGYCRSILKHNADRLDEQPRNQLKDVCEGIQRTEQLIDALLGLSTLAQGELTRVSVNMSEMAKSVADELMLAEPERHVTFRYAEDVAGNGDKRLLRVVLQNLLNNAWKYTGEQEDAVVEFGVKNRKGIQTFFVRDNGAGFDIALAEKLFVPFQRLHGTETFKGHGIGLATVKKIITLHNGGIWAESSTGKGTIFYFTLGDDQLKLKHRLVPGKSNKNNK